MSGVYRIGCGICDEVLSGVTEAALSEAQVDHLTKHFEDYLEVEVAEGRAERVERDGRTLYRISKPEREA